MANSILNYIDTLTGLHLYPRIGWVRDNGLLIPPFENALYQVQKGLMQVSFGFVLDNPAYPIRYAITNGELDPMTPIALLYHNLEPRIPHGELMVLPEARQVGDERLLDLQTVLLQGFLIADHLNNQVGRY